MHYFKVFISTLPPLNVFIEKSHRTVPSPLQAATAIGEKGQGTVYQIDREQALHYLATHFV